MTTAVREAAVVGELVGVLVDYEVAVGDFASVGANVGSGVIDSFVEFLHIVKSKTPSNRNTFIFPGIRSQYILKGWGNYGAAMPLV